MQDTGSAKLETTIGKLLINAAVTLTVAVLGVIGMSANKDVYSKEARDTYHSEVNRRIEKLENITGMHIEPGRYHPPEWFKNQIKEDTKELKIRVQRIEDRFFNNK